MFIIFFTNINIFAYAYWPLEGGNYLESHWYVGVDFVGVAVGCGWQAIVAYINIGCYYGVGVPVGCVLGFKFDLGVKVWY